MVQRIAGLVAGSAALATLLSGLHQGAPVGVVLQRVVGAWLVFYGLAAVLGALTRIAMAPGPPRARRGAPTRGTDRADRD